MLCKMISVIWFFWWGWTERLGLSRRSILLMLKRDAFIGSASINSVSRMDRADQALPSHHCHHLAWCSPSSNMKMSTLHLFSQLRGFLGEVSCRHMGPSPFPEPISLNFKSWHSTKELSASHFCTLLFLLKMGWRDRIKVWRRQQGIRGAEKDDQMNTLFQQEKSPITLLVLVRKEDIGNMLGRDTSCW